MADQGIINALFGGPSWLEQANQQRQKDIANYLQGGVPQMMADTQGTQNLAGGFGGTTTGKLPGIRAYHGSPFDFEKFSASNIGTGQGAQSYGHGLYFAENPAVAQHYREMLAGSQPDIINLKLGNMNIGPHNGFDYSKNASRSTLDNIHASLAEDVLIDQSGLLGAPDKQDFVLKRLEEKLADYKQNWPEGYEAGLKLKQKLSQPGAIDLKVGPQPGKMYEVNINAKPEQFLDWDKPLSEQPQAVQNILNPIAKKLLEGENPYVPKQLEKTGDVIQYGRAFASPEEALQQAGIPGIKYLDQGSRTGGQGTSNYVVFDPSLIDITKKWALIGALMGGGGLASQQAGEPGQ